MDSLISFKAGLANLIDGVVTPDPRRGEVRVVAVEADGLLHFQWRERKASGPSGPEIDIVIFPEEADFIKDVQPGARVLQLRFKEESRQHLFFWMQESDPSRDAELCQLVQEAINMGDEGGASASELGRSAVFEAAEISGQDEVSSREPGGIQASDLARILAGMSVPPVAGGSQAAAAAPVAVSNPAVSPERLASILAGVVGQSAAAQPQLPSLAEVLTPQNLVPLLQEDGLRRRLGELVEHLPREHQEEAAAEPLAAVTEALRSAPLQNQLRTLSHALASGQLDYSQFGLQPLGYSAADFLQSIQNKADAEKEKEEKRQ